MNNSGIHLYLNGADVTAGLTFSGSGPVNASYMQICGRSNAVLYTAVITV